MAGMLSYSFSFWRMQLSFPVFGLLSLFDIFNRVHGSRWLHQPQLDKITFPFPSFRPVWIKQRLKCIDNWIHLIHTGVSYIDADPCRAGKAHYKRSSPSVLLYHRCKM